MIHGDFILKIYFLSTNAHKREEFQELLGADYQVQNAFSIFKDLVPEEESGSTFWENALLKLAPVLDKSSNGFFFAEDSGLCCHSLNGLPGILSARLAGENATDRKRRKKLLDMLKGHYRTAFFVTCLAIRDPQGQVIIYEGRVYGQIAEQEKGEGGFGYDPIFLPWGFDKTFAEMPLAQKNRISHRSRACEGLKNYLKKYR
ncbi:RdgB/HAM1 family non-canonical purine NTP pyrophosphatase [Candidatus Riflebacteria bacterium]